MCDNTEDAASYILCYLVPGVMYLEEVKTFSLAGSQLLILSCCSITTGLF